MTHNTGALSKTEKLPYGEYIERGVALGGAQFAIPKAADIQHNSRIDADASQIENENAELSRLKRKAKYEASKHTLLMAANHFPDIDNNWIIHSIFAVNREEMNLRYHQLPRLSLTDDEVSPSL